MRAARTHARHEEWWIATASSWRRWLVRAPRRWDPRPILGVSRRCTDQGGSLSRAVDGL